MALSNPGDGGESGEALRWAMEHQPCSLICVVAPWLPDAYIDNGIRQMQKLAEDISVARFLILTVLSDGQDNGAPRKAYHRPASNVRHVSVPEDLMRAKLFSGKSYTLPITLVVQNRAVKESVPGLRPGDVELVASKARQAAQLTQSTAISGQPKLPNVNGQSSNGTAAPLKLPDALKPCPETVGELLSAAHRRAGDMQRRLQSMSPAGGAALDPQQIAQLGQKVTTLLSDAENLRYGGGAGEKSRARVLHERGQETIANLSLAENLLDRAEGHAGQEALTKMIAQSIERVDERAPWLQETLEQLRSVHSANGRGASKRLSPLASSLINLSLRSPSKTPAGSSAAHNISSPTATRLFADSHAPSPQVPSHSPHPPSSSSLRSPVPSPSPQPLSTVLSSVQADASKSARESREERRSILLSLRQHLPGA